MERWYWQLMFFLFCFMLCDCFQQTEAEDALGQYFNERQKKLEEYFYSDVVEAEVASDARYLLNNSVFHGSFGIEEKLFAKAMKYKFHRSHQLYLMRDQLRSELATAFQGTNLKPDRDLINDSLLLEHALLSRKVKNRPWNQYLSDEEFRQYVLPYRAHREPIDHTWRRHFQRELLPMIDTFNQKHDPIAVCSFVNTHLGKKYELRRIKEQLPGELSFQQINQLEGGMCEELVNVTTYAMRSIGLPVVRDFTPAWGKQAHFGHHWLALVLPNGTTLAFDGTYRNPEIGKNNPSRIAAKVYRFNFQVDRQKLETLAAISNGLPMLEFVRSPYITDVTSLYYETVDLRLPLPNNELSSKHHCLGVFNNGQWEPIVYGVVDSRHDSLVFKDINRDIVYILLRSRGDNWLPSGDPFLVDSTGRKEYLSPQSFRQVCLETWFDWEEKPIQDTDTLKLEYWHENNWQIIQDGIEPVNGRICVSDVPSNALLRLTNYRGRPYYMRPFVSREDDQPTFY